MNTNEHRGEGGLEYPDCIIIHVHNCNDSELALYPGLPCLR